MCKTHRPTKYKPFSINFITTNDFEDAQYK